MFKSSFHCKGFYLFGASLVLIMLSIYFYVNNTYHCAEISAMVAAFSILIGYTMLCDRYLNESESNH